MTTLKKVLMLGTVVAASLVLGGCKLYRTGTTGTGGTGTGQQQQSPSTTSPVQGEVLITYSDNGFAPGGARAKVGQKVEFSNASSTTIQVNSAPHPTHTLYPELNIGTIAPNETKSVTFTKPGTYKYHDHLNASRTGEIVVE